MGKLANLNNVEGDGRSLENVKSRYQERLAEFCVNRATTNRCSIVRQRIDSPFVSPTFFDVPGKCAHSSAEQSNGF